MQQPTGLPAAPLLSVANRALLRHALDWLAAAGIHRAVVVVSPAAAKEAQKVADQGRQPIAIDWLEQLPGEPLADTLTAAARFLEREPFVLHLADSIAKRGLRSLIKQGPPTELDALLLVHEDVSSQPDGVIDLRPRLEREPPCFRVRRGAPAGVAVMGAGALQAAAALDSCRGRGLEAVASRLLELGGRVRTCRVHEWWRFRGGAEALLEGNRFALEALRPDYERARLLDSDIQGAVVAHATARIESSIVRGPAVIGPGADVRNAYVGPYTSIGEGVMVEGAEIEHSVVLAGASIKHLGGRLEASVVGRDAMVFRDFRLPRALRLQVGEGARVSLA